MRPPRLVHLLTFWLLTTVVACVLALGAWSAWHLHQGFARYLLARDVARLERLAELSSQVVTEAGGLEALQSRRVHLRQLLQELARLEGDAPARPPGPELGPGGAPHAGPPTAGGWGSRIALTDAQGRWLMGPRLPGPPQILERRPVQVQGETVAWLLMQPPRETVESVDLAFLRAQYQGIAAMAVGLCALAALAAWMLARRIGRPLQALGEAAQHIAQGARRVDIPSAGVAELDELIAHLQTMAQSLQRLEHSRRRWLADIAHELRTPLTGLRLDIEALVDGVRSATPDTLAGLKADMLRLQALVDDLHLLALADLSALPCRRSALDAVALMADIVKQVQPRCEQAGLHLTWQPACASLEVVWDALRIRQVMHNLLSNSLRYTDAPGEIRLSMAHTSAQVLLTLEDSAPGLSAASLSQMFEPLFRTESARDRERGGSGLGLAICQAIVHSHGGTIRAEASALGGVRIRLSLPLTAPENTHG